MENKNIEQTNLSETPEDELAVLEDKPAIKKEKSPKTEESPKSLIKLIKRVNVLLNENARLKAKNRDLEKIYLQTVLFLKEVSPKHPLHKKAVELLSDFNTRLEKHEKKKD